MEIRREFPHKIVEASPRQWSIAVGRITTDILRARYGLEPSQELIETTVEEIIATPDKRFLFRGAMGLIVDEFNKEIERFAGEGSGVTREARRKAKDSIKKRYEEIEGDPQRDFSYLDPILRVGS